MHFQFQRCLVETDAGRDETAVLGPKPRGTGGEEAALGDRTSNPAPPHQVGHRVQEETLQRSQR